MPIPRVNERTAVPIAPESFIKCYLRFRIDFVSLLQASGGCVGRTADGVARHQKFYPAVLLTAGGIVVRGHRQSVAEALGADRIRRNTLLHQVIAHRTGAVLG